MRVFYAVTFHEKTKEKLAEYRDRVADHSIKGRFTNTANLHLTLEFIGDIKPQKLSLLTSFLKELKNLPKQLSFSHIGSFKRKDKEIIWVGIKENNELMELQKELRNLLIKNGFDIENRKYRPHITIGRQVVRNDFMDKIDEESIEIPIRSIALMESKRVNNKLIYEPVEEIIIDKE